MKKTIVFALMLAGAMVAAFAQESKTSLSTAGVFGNDVDDYLDVHSWKDVQPEKLFGFLGAGVTFQDQDANNNLHGRYDIGVGKQFKPFFWGTYFGGDFGEYLSQSTEISGAGAGQNGANTTRTYANNDITAWDFENLVGIGNFGIRLGFKYYDNGSTSTSATGASDVKTSNKAWQLKTTAGINVASEKVSFTPYAGVHYDYNMNVDDFDELLAGNAGNKVIGAANGLNPAYGQTSDNGAGTTTDSTQDDLGFFVGTGIEFAKKDNVQQKLNGEITLDIGLFGKDAVDATTNMALTNATSIKLGLHPSYTVKYDASEKLKVGATLALPFDFGFGDYAQFAITPSIAAGLTYRAKEKFTVNAGLELNVVSISYTSFSTTAGGITTTTSVWAIAGATDINGNPTGNEGINIYTGFNYAFTPKVSLDFNWNLFAGIFGTSFTSEFADNTTSQATAGATDDFFYNINRIFRNQISFIVIVKL